MLCFSEGQGAVEGVLPAWLTTHTELGSWLHQQKRVGAATGILPTSCMHVVWPARKPGGCSHVQVRWRNMLPSMLSPTGFPLFISVIGVPVHKRKTCILPMCSIYPRAHFLAKQSLCLFPVFGKGNCKVL